MAKKLLTAFCVLLASAALFVCVCLLVLFLAPGTEILGIRYIANGISKYEQDNLNLAALTNREEFSGNIYIETYGVPITIEYTPYVTSHVSFHQDFVGLTKSKNRVASLEASVDENDDLHIKVNEIVPWLYQTKIQDGFFFTLNLATTLQDRDLHIISTKSNVTINNARTYDTLEIVTSGSLKLSGDVFATNLIYHTSGEITVGEHLSCTNADLLSSNNNINIISGMEGTLKAETRGGDIRFVSCSSLDAKTDSGDVTQYGDGLNSVKGEVSVLTRSGDVNLGTIGTETDDTSDKSELASITSVSGSVTISRMLDGEISSDRGKVNVYTARNLVLSCKTGDISIKDVKNELVINGRNGNVVVGEGGTIYNPTIKTTTGTITAFNTRGKVYLESKSNSVSLTNADSNDLTLNAGRELTAKNLQGKVSSRANGNVEMTFSYTPTGLELDVGSRGKKVNVDLSCTEHTIVNYDIRSTKGKIARLYAGDSTIVESSYAKSNQVDGFPNIYIRTIYGEVTVKFA